MFINELNNIFKNICDYDIINKINTIKLRNIKNGISLSDALFYRLKYTQPNYTKDNIVSDINFTNNTNFSRQAFTDKENNIDLNVYNNILSNIINCYNKKIKKSSQKIVAIDGTYNNDDKMNQLINMGFYDITNNIPIDLKCYGKEGKNKEVKLTQKYIRDNLENFRNTIIVCDRAYYCFDFFKFLNDHNIRFIIRAKGSASNLYKKNSSLKKSNPNYNKILQIIPLIRIIKCTQEIDKKVFTNKSKNINKMHTIRVKNDCNLITNINYSNNYTNSKILELYQSRWEIEIFFKYLKSNFKFQHNEEKNKNDDNYKKMNISRLIIIYIQKLLEDYYLSDKKINKLEKINKSNLLKGIFNHILYKIVKGKLLETNLKIFYKSHIIIIKNKEGRSFPRTSKIPFSKWYIKEYSLLTQYNKIINAIMEETVNNLNKNLKLIAMKIISINGKNVNNIK